MSEETTTVEALEPGMSGQWLVTTQGSTHLWDLDNMTYQRRPGQSSPSFSEDGETVKITRVGVWPKVGERSVLFYDDLEYPVTMEQWRVSSQIVRIESQ